jgi:hypothetical protein
VTACISARVPPPPPPKIPLRSDRFKTVTYTSTTAIWNRRHDGEAIDVVERMSLLVVRTKYSGSVDPESAKARIKALLKQPLGLVESETSDPIELD